jgi:hypothetical protein
LIALDFGRVYLGYINLQNMARIAANFAANNSSAWDATPNANDAKLKTKYYNQIIADAQAINCQLIDANGDGTSTPDDFTPTFTDRNGNGNYDRSRRLGHGPDRLSLRVITRASRRSSGTP